MKPTNKRAAFTLIELATVSGRKRRAFTLIELLVVVAIITALIAILLPSLGRATAIASRAACRSNQRQIAIAYINYANASQFAVPFNHLYEPAWPDSAHDYPWTVQLLPMLGGSREVFLCPDHQRYWPAVDYTLTDDWEYFEQRPGYATSYSMKIDLGASRFDPTDRQANNFSSFTFDTTATIVTPFGHTLPVVTRVTQVRAPSSTIITADRWQMHADEHGDPRQVNYVDGHVGELDEPHLYRGVSVQESPFFMQGEYLHTTTGNVDG